MRPAATLPYPGTFPFRGPPDPLIPYACCAIVPDDCAGGDDATVIGEYDTPADKPERR
jgi:hypothetical protein